MKKVLIIEDDLDAANVLEAYLTREHFQTVIATDGQRGLELALSWKPDLILLDVMLPSMSGTDVLMSLRQKVNTPIIMVTALGDDQDKISALRFGADDYVVKPYNPGEVVARVQAVIRRSVGIHKKQELQYENITLDTESLCVFVTSPTSRKIYLDVTRTELSLLMLFMASPHKAFTRQALMEASLPESEALERVIDTHVYNLRKKLDSAGQSGLLINVRGIGYRFSDK